MTVVVVTGGVVGVPGAGLVEDVPAIVVDDVFADNPSVGCWSAHCAGPFAHKQRIEAYGPLSPAFMR